MEKAIRRVEEAGAGAGPLTLNERFQMYADASSERRTAQKASDQTKTVTSSKKLKEPKASKGKAKAAELPKETWVKTPRGLVKKSGGSKPGVFEVVLQQPVPVSPRGRGRAVRGGARGSGRATLGIARGKGDVAKPKQKQKEAAAIAGSGRGRRGGRGRGGPGSEGANVQQLDKELDAYMSKNPVYVAEKVQKEKDELDADIEAYKTEQPQ